MSHLKICALVVIAMITFSLDGCSALQVPEVSPAPKEVQLTQKGGACGSGVGLMIGDTLELILDGDSSSSNTWEVGFYVPAVIKPADEQKNPSGPNMISASDLYTFRFLAVGEGQAELVMIYKPLGNDLPVLETCQVDVTVK